jgi:hypothetical protein
MGLCLAEKTPTSACAMSKGMSHENGNQPNPRRVIRATPPSMMTGASPIRSAQEFMVQLFER